MTTTARSLLLVGLMLGVLQAAVGAVPQTLSYQGILTDGTGAPVQGAKAITISLYTANTGGSPFWTETQTLTLVDGRLSVVLGADPAKPLDPSRFTGETWIGIKVGNDTEMPRQKFSSVAYAFQAGDGGVPKGGIIMWSGAVDAVPAGWALCNGQNGTPNLRDRFVVGAGGSYNLDDRGGETGHSLTLGEMPTHNHGGVTTSESALHTHSDSGHSHIGTLTSVNSDGTSGTRVREARDTGPNGGIAFSTNAGYAILGTQSAAHNHSISGQGAGIAHENRPPYYALAFIMKL